MYSSGTPRPKRVHIEDKKLEKYANFNTFCSEPAKMSWLLHSLPGLGWLIKRVAQVTNTVFFDRLLNEDNKLYRQKADSQAKNLKFLPLIFDFLTIKYLRTHRLQIKLVYSLISSIWFHYVIWMTAYTCWITQAKNRAESSRRWWLVNFPDFAMALINHTSCRRIFQ